MDIHSYGIRDVYGYSCGDRIKLTDTTALARADDHDLGVLRLRDLERRLDPLPSQELFADGRRHDPLEIGHALRLDPLAVGFLALFCQDELHPLTLLVRPLFLLDRVGEPDRRRGTDERHDAMWRAMGDGFNVPRERFQVPEPMIPTVQAFHEYLTEMCRGAQFGAAVSATNYAVEGVAQKISEKALRGLAKNEKIGPRGRWWLEEHAKYDDEHPIHALEIIKNCVQRGETPDSVTEAARHSLALMKDAMVASYDS